MKRFELLTFGFGDQRYHQLSYTRFFKNSIICSDSRHRTDNLFITSEVL